MWTFSNIYHFFRPAGAKKRSGRRGFTLIELLVVMSIMVIITSVLLIRQSKFDSSTILRSLSYSVALSVRQAQIYGSSVLGTTTAQVNCIGGNYSSGNCYASAYGIHLTSNTTGSYILFADLNNNGRYDPGEDIKAFSLNAGYIISGACVNQISPATQLCFGSTLSTLDIVFRRPNPDACFASDVTANPNGPGACQAGATAVFSKASIQLQNNSDNTSTRYICIYQTGQIAVEPLNTPCP